MRLEAWFRHHFGIKNQIGSEVQTDCPFCNHKSFYFNLSKGIGYCHRASCGATPNTKSLSVLVGTTPDQLHLQAHEEIEIAETEVLIPGELLDKNNPEHAQYVNYLLSRDITPDNVNRNIWFVEGNRIYVPVFFEGRMVNYVGRDITGTEYLKYVYAPGVKTFNYILNWDYFRNEKYISLVENTFVAISNAVWMNTTTTFGSHLSDIQAKRIAASRVRIVGIIWDEGAEHKASKAVEKLESLGVNAFYIEIKGQPDDYCSKDLYEMLELGEESRKLGSRRFVYKKELQNA